MKFLTVLAAACVGAHGASWSADTLDASYSFEQFQADFGKEYKSAEEKEHRRQVFTNSLKKALVHNADKSQTWKMAINQFSDITREEFAGSHGWQSVACTASASRLAT